MAYKEIYELTDKIEKDWKKDSFFNAKEHMDFLNKIRTTFEEVEEQDKRLDKILEKVDEAMKDERIKLFD